jgi:hypothetical protein
MKKKISAPANPELFQNVILTFDDGTTGIFSGKAICFEGETKKIRKTEFSIPKPLPEGYTFEEAK